MSEASPAAAASVPAQTTPSSPSPSPAPSSSSDVPAVAPDHLDVDLILVFDSAGADLSDEQKTQAAAEAALKDLLFLLANAGFDFTIRVNRPGSVFIFVKASDAVVATASYQSEARDWKMGVRTTVPVAPSATDAQEFSVAERLRLVHDRLTKPEKENGLGITPGEGDWVYISSIFAPHDPAFDVAWIKRWSKKYVLDDDELELIRNTFGEKVALYFAFLQYYFKWLLFPTIAGIFAYLFLSPFSPLFALINAVWCCVFVEAWKRHELDLAVKWGVKGCSNLHATRATFKGETERSNPITGEREQYYPSWKRVVKQFTAIPTALVAGVLLMALQGVVFVIEIFLAEIYDGPLKQYLVFLPTALLATLVPTFTAFYSIVVTKMTNWENHVSAHAYETSMTQKMFVLNFLTSYMGLFLSSYVYLPFGHLIAPNIDFITSTVKRVVGESAAQSKKTFSINTLRLRQQYIYFTATAQAINFFVETLLPYIQRRLFKEAKKLSNKVTGAQTLVYNDDPAESAFLGRVRAEVEFPEYEVDEDYREMIVQFGYLSLFSTVWPLAPLFSFINNWVELRGDAVKICLDTKRPIPSKAESIGAWLNNLSFLTWLGSLTTSSLVSLYRNSATSLESGELVSTRPWMLLTTVLLSEHVYFAVRYLVSVIFNALESPVVLDARRENYVARSGMLSATTLETENEKEQEVAEDVRESWRAKVQDAVVVFGSSLELKTEAEKKEE
ncbi:calcium-activated chloride channel-domain-containing protein [Myxozyma melibiosi]|uniref:Calcium-activated chloride channel-domain-containing protein n=1 Tax=Myxozyma melibiosi TaxID=54550 RepID=A0ABR1F2G1_9ASCO